MLTKRPVPRSNPAVTVSRGVMRTYQWKPGRAVGRRGVDHEVVGRVAEQPAEPAEHVVGRAGDDLDLGVGRLVEAGAGRAVGDQYLERLARCRGCTRRARDRR